MRRHMRVLLSLGFGVLVMLLVVGSCAAQIMFERTYGDSLGERAHCVWQTQDGGYVLGGMSDSYGAGDSDWYLVRTDSIGELLWLRTYGTDGGDWCSSVLETSNGDFVASGDMFPFAGDPSCWLLGLDPSGDTIWATNHGPVMSLAGVTSQTSDGGFITAMTADTVMGPGSHSHLCLVKTNWRGQLLWMQIYEDTLRRSGSDVAQTVDGGYIVVGSAEPSDTNDPSNAQLTKTDALGHIVWSKTFGGPERDNVRSVAETPDGGYLMAGYTRSFGAGGWDVWLVRTDSLGDSLWTKTYGGPLDDEGSSIDRTSDGAYVIAGWTCSYGAGSGDVLLMKVDSTGEMIWMRTYGGPLGDEGFSVQQTDDGGYIIAGRTDSYGAGGSDVYLIKTDENGLTGAQEERTEFGLRGSTRVLLENRPNPFSSWTVVSFSLPLASDVTLEIYDIAGRLLETPVNDRQKPGVHKIRWDRKEYSSGVYFCRLRMGDSVRTRKMVLVD